MFKGSTIFFILLFLLAAPLLAQQEMQDSTKASEEDRIHALHDKIIKEGKLTSQLKESDLANLPIGIVKDIGGNRQIIMLDGLRLTPNGAYFNAYVSLDLPFAGKKIAFAAENVALQPAGIAASVGTRLVMVGDQKIPLGKHITLILPGSDKRNFVEWDCNGFKSVNLKGLFEFSRDMILPEKPDGSIAEGKVAAALEINTTDPGSILTTINLPPFQHARLKGVSFQVQNAVADFSDIVNHGGMVFPKDYVHGLGEDVALWQGFYIQRATVKLPHEISGKAGRKSIDAQHLLIDNIGFSGAVGAANLFGTDEGSMSGWPFSIDSLGIQFVKNSLKGGAFRGDIQIPLFDKESSLGYQATIFNEKGETNYQFLVAAKDTLKASALVADIKLLKGSVIKISKIDGKLKPEAILQGIATVSKGDKVALRELRFENLHLTAEKPYILGGVWAFTGKEQKVSGFPVTINNIQFTHSQEIMALRADVGLNLMNSEDKGFGAVTTVTVKGKLEETGGTPTGGVSGETPYQPKKQKWKFDGIDVSDILINVNGGAYKIAGTLSIYEKDSVYGNGFRGQVTAFFEPGLEVKAIAQFGSVNNYRYWYVDAKTMFGTPVGNGLGFYGFGGGIYYHMEQVHMDVLKLEDAKELASLNQKVGISQSGIIYKPNKEVGIGLKATVIVGTTPKPEPFNGDATFEMAFNSKGGIRYISFLGEAYFMTPMKQRSATPPLYGKLFINYDNTNKVLHGTLDTYVNVEDVLTGIHQGGLAGRAVMHFAGKNDWYIHIGTPQQRIGINFIGLVQAESYLMVGTNIPSMPELPAEILNSRMMQGADLSMARDDAALGAASGFAFGSSLRVSTGRLQVLMFYGEFNAGLGFDVMLKDYGKASCVGRSGAVGINGWYASGQAWSYVQGVIGIRVDMKFIKGEFDILKIGAAAVLQAELPNPVWMQGVVGGEYDILGGLVSGNCRFKMTIGERCEMQGTSSVAGIKVIASVSPQEAEGDVSVFTAPQVAFNMAMDKTYEMLNKNNEYKAYRVKLAALEVRGEGGAQIAGEIRWNEKKDVAVFKPFEVLPQKQKIHVSVRIVWEERINGSWKALGEGGKQEEEEVKVAFTTGEAPKHIPEENVLYAYPVKGQYNFFKGEYPEGYIKLDGGQEYLFKEKDEQGIEWNYYARFETPSNPTPIDKPLKYNSSNASLHFPIPMELANETAYELHILKLPKQATAIDGNVTASTKQVYGEEGTTVSTKDKTISGTLALPQDYRLYKLQFRTSKYNRFEEKLMAATNHQSLAIIIEGWNLMKLGYKFDSEEVLDKIDIYGAKGQAPLVQVEAVHDNLWYSKYMYPTLYEYYPVNSELRIDEWRKDEPAGTPPVRVMPIYQQDRTITLAEGQTAAYSIGGTVYFNYDMEYFTFMDYKELSNKAWNKYAGNYSSAPVGAKRLMSASYTNLLPHTNYNFKIRYVLPGLNKVTKEKIYSIKN